MSGTRRAPSVRTRTTVVAAGVVLIALGVGAFGLVWLVRDRLTSADRSATVLRARDVLALAQSDDLPSRLSFPGDENGATQVLDASGVVVASTDNVEGESPISPLRPAAGATSSDIRQVDAIDDEQRYVVVAVAAGDGARTVVSATSLESTEDTVSALTEALVIGLPIVILMVAITTRILVGRALRPVAAITAEVSDITDRELDRRVPEPSSSDEIQQLAVTMNRMLGRLEESSVRQRRFVADASHELRSPLASARAALEVAALHPDSRESLVAAINDALIDHDRLDRLAKDLLALARLDGRGSVGIATEVDVGSVVATLVERRPEGTITLDMKGDLALARTSEHAVVQVMTNLLDNAARHRASTTQVRVSQQRGRLVLEVHDDGLGIPAADRERVFEPFTRLDEARVADEGTGLGLAIVNELVTSLGGTVSIGESDLGGAAVLVRLPG